MEMSWVSLQALSGQAVDHTVLFSSIAALTGPAGSSNYAAVNASLEAASARLQSQGRHLPSYLHCPVHITAQRNSTCCTRVTSCNSQPYLKIVSFILCACAHI